MGICLPSYTTHNAYEHQQGRNTISIAHSTPPRLMHTSIYETQLKHDLLSVQEEQTLLQQAQAGDTNARDKLILLNMRLVRDVVKKYEQTDFGITADDLMADGVLGLNRAIEKYDESFGTRLSTYATLWIHQAVSRSPFLKGTVRLTQDVEKLVRKINRAKAALAQADEPITAETLSQATGIKMKEVQRLMHLDSEVLPTQSLDEYGPDERTALLHTIADPSSEDTYTAVEIKMDLEFFLSQLYPEERFIIERSYGIPIHLENSDIAKAIGCHRNYITQKRENIFKMLKTLANALRGNIHQQKKALDTPQIVMRGYQPLISPKMLPNTFKTPKNTKRKRKQAIKRDTSLQTRLF